MKLKFLSEHVWCLNQQVDRSAAWVHGDQSGAWVFRVGLEPMFTRVSLVIRSVVMGLGPESMCINLNLVSTGTKQTLKTF